MPRKLSKLPETGKRSPPTPLSIRELDEARLKSRSSFAPYIPKPAAFAANRIGRPSSYDRKYCRTVLDDAARGHTFGATAALIGVARSTLSDWASAHPEFADAIERAKSIRQRFYEGHLIDMVRRGGDSTRFSAVKLGLINTGGDDWKDKLTADHDVAFTLGDLIKQSMQLPVAPAPAVIEGESIKDRGG
jgi:hypothetical protein